MTIGVRGRQNNPNNELLIHPVSQGLLKAFRNLQDAVRMASVPVSEAGSPAVDEHESAVPVRSARSGRSGQGAVAGAVTGGEVYVPMPVYRRLAISGWALYAIAWITPGLHGVGIGAQAFFAAVRYGVAFSVHPDSLSGFTLGLCLLCGWLANFSIFLPLPVWARIVWSAAPGFPFAAVLLLPHAPLSVGARAASLLPFYPWALGIALIHIAHIAQDRRARAAHAM
jgi:hypothetical protein